VLAAGAALLLAAGCGAAAVPAPAAAGPAAPAAAPAAPAAPAVPEPAKAEAVDLLGAAIAERQAGKLGIAWELGRQALAQWPDYADAKTFVAEVEAQRQAEQKAAEERAAAEAKRQAEARAAAERAAAVAQAAEHRAQFAATLRTFDPTGAAVVRVERGSTDDELKVTVANAWHYEPHQIRLQTAQSLWKAWAAIHAPADLDRARLRLVDLNGNDVGGSGWLGGSMVSVKK
jgi:hypothetical protein